MNRSGDTHSEHVSPIFRQSSPLRNTRTGTVVGNAASTPDNSNVVIRIDPDYTSTYQPPATIATNTNGLQQQQQQLMDQHRPAANPVIRGGNLRINMESDRSIGASRNREHNNLLSTFINEARTQFGRQRLPTIDGGATARPTTSTAAATSLHVMDDDNVDGAIRQNGTISGNGANATASRSVRSSNSWRNVFLLSAAPSTETLRSLISHSNSFRYTALSTSDSNPNNTATFSTTHNAAAPALTSSAAGMRFVTRSNSIAGVDQSRAADSNSELGVAPLVTHSEEPNESVPLAHYTSAAPPAVSNSLPLPTNQQPRPVDVQASGGRRHQPSMAPPTTAPPIDPHPDDEDNNVISNGLVKLLGLLARYLPFICILFVKFIHDHLLGILDLVLLHGIMYQVNKSLREQVAKFSQKSYGVLVRDFGLIASVIAYRFLLAAAMPDPFGLLITPPREVVTVKVPLAGTGTGSAFASKTIAVTTAPVVIDQLSAEAMSADPLESAVTITKALSLGVLLYYVAVNDLVLKLLTILVKISITMLPATVIRHKPRARMFVLVEYASQFYRALAPVRQWLVFLFESYSGLEVISGVLFSSFYFGAKGFEFLERGKVLRKALLNFLRNTDYERKPTKEELDGAGTICPICHDAYATPVVLDCGHIFCDDCVGTWFKREQTCPMCRAKVNEDPTWQDGSTSFFYQFC